MKLTVLENNAIALTKSCDKFDSLVAYRKGDFVWIKKSSGLKEKEVINLFSEVAK